MDAKTKGLPDRLREHADEHQAESDAEGDDWTLYGMREGRMAQDLREAAERLERIDERAATKSCHGNGAERLCRILYGRGAEIGDTIGGLDAQMLHDAAAEIERTGWRDIATAPRDGSAFQAWLTGAGSTGWWEPICNFGPSGRLGVWRRIDGRYDFDYSLTHITATHWMPRPSCPTPGGAF
jgi:hypothetical protein